MSKNLSNSVQKESTQVPVSGKAKKGSSESCQNMVATIEQQDCAKVVISCTEILKKIVSDSCKESNIYELVSLRAQEIQKDFISICVEKMKEQIRFYINNLRKEDMEKVEYLRKMNQDIHYNYRTLPSYKVVRYMLDRLNVGAKETDNYSFGFSSTVDGLKKIYKECYSIEINENVIYNRINNSVLRFKIEARERKLKELEEMCATWIKAGITKDQATLMNATLKDSTLSAYIDYLDLLENKNESKED